MVKAKKKKKKRVRPGHGYLQGTIISVMPMPPKNEWGCRKVVHMAHTKYSTERVFWAWVSQSVSTLNTAISGHILQKALLEATCISPTLIPCKLLNIPRLMQWYKYVLVEHKQCATDCAIHIGRSQVVVSNSYKLRIKQAI
jgi:hypothetical protein